VDHRRFDLDEALAPTPFVRCRAAPFGSIDAVASYTASARWPQASTDFAGSIALADDAVGPIDPKDMPTVTILHVV
jgi:hypothetical protein